MRKIPTLFVRDPDDRKHVLPAVTPGCEWVLKGEGVATRKYDGTCCMYDGNRWWVRREVKPGRPEPDGWVEVDHDETTGKRVGWEPAEQSGFAKYLLDAVSRDSLLPALNPGTYELVGPKINGNPEQVFDHLLIAHGFPRSSEVAEAPRNFDRLRDWLLAHDEYEGIVWHHPDGRMAKLKRRDFT